MTQEEYKDLLLEALKQVDWRNPRDRESPAVKVLAKAAKDRSLPLEQWQALYDLYFERTKP